MGILCMLTFSIVDLSGTGSLKLGVGTNMLRDIPIFLRRKDNAFFLVAFFGWSRQISFPFKQVLRRSWPLVFVESPQTFSPLLLSSSKLGGKLKVSSWTLWVSKSSAAFDSWETCLWINNINSFWSSTTSSGVRSGGWPWEADCLPWRLHLSGSSLRLLIPNVPIASNPWGQSLISSLLGSSRVWSIIKDKVITRRRKTRPFQRQCSSYTNNALKKISFCSRLPGGKSWFKSSWKVLLAPISHFVHGKQSSELARLH